MEVVAIIIIFFQNTLDHLKSLFSRLIHVCLKKYTNRQGAETQSNRREREFKYRLFSAGKSLTATYKWQLFVHYNTTGEIRQGVIALWK